MKDSVYKILKLVRMYPEPFVKGSSVLLMLVGFTGTLLKLVMPIPAFTVVTGMGIWVFQDDIAEKIRYNPLGEMLGQMDEMMKEVEK